MLVVLKIPMVYLGGVVWYAVRTEPGGTSGSEDVGVLAPEPPPPRLRAKPIRE